MAGSVSFFRNGAHPGCRSRTQPSCVHPCFWSRHVHLITWYGNSFFHLFTFARVPFLVLPVTSISLEMGYHLVLVSPSHSDGTLASKYLWLWPYFLMPSASVRIKISSAPRNCVAVAYSSTHILGRYAGFPSCQLPVSWMHLCNDNKAAIAAVIPISTVILIPLHVL